MVDVLRAAERLPGPRPELALQEVTEGLLQDVTDLREVALPHSTDLNFGESALRIESGAIDGGPHLERPARSSSRVITPE